MNYHILMPDGSVVGLADTNSTSDEAAAGASMQCGRPASTHRGAPGALRCRDTTTLMSPGRKRGPESVCRAGTDLAQKLLHARVQSFMRARTHLLDFHALECLGQLPLLRLVEYLLGHHKENFVLFLDMLSKQSRIGAGG